MSFNIGQAVGYLDLDTSKFEGGLNSALSMLKTFNDDSATMSDKFAAAGSVMTSAGSTLTKTVTAPIAVLGAVAVKTASGFESSMSQVQATMGITKDATSTLHGETVNTMGALGSLAQEMGSTTKFSASEAADAINILAMAGYDVDQIYGALPSTLNLAAAGGMGIADAADIATGVLSGFGYEADQTAMVSDKLAMMASSAKGSVQDFGTGMAQVAGQAKITGQSFDSTATALAVLGNHNIGAAEGGNMLQRVLKNLYQPTDSARKAFDALGVSAYDSSGNARPLEDVLMDLNGKLGELSEEDYNSVMGQIFDTASLRGAAFLIQDVGDAFDSSDPNSLSNKIKGASDAYDGMGAAQGQAQAQMDNLEGQITILKSSLEGLAISFGDILLPIIQDVTAGIQSVVDWLNNLSDEQKEHIVKIAEIVAAIGPALLILGKVVTIGSKVTKWASMLKKGLTLLQGAFAGLSAPVVAIVAVIAALVAAFVHLWNTNEEFREKITAIWDGIKQKFSDFAQGIVDRLNDLGFDFENITEVLGALWDGFCNLLAPVFEGAFEVISAVLGTVLDVLTGLLDVFIGVFTGDWEQVWTGVQEIFGGIWDGITGIFSAVLDTLKGVADVFLGWFGTSWDELWTGIKDFFEGIWNGIVTFITDTLDSIKATFTNIWNGITDFLSSAWETIKNVVQVGIMFVVELLKAAFQLITLPFRFIWENCKEVILAAWDKIKTTVSNAVDSIKSTIEKVWNAIVGFLKPILEGIKTTFTNIWNSIKDIISKVWDAIKTTISTIINSIKTTISNVFNAVKTTISNVFGAIKTTASNIWNGIKSAIETPINAAKTTITNIVNAIKSIVSNGFNAAKSTVSNIFNDIKNTISNVLNSAKSVVSNAIENIKSKFNFTWSLPKLKLPHPRISGRFSLNPPSVPHFSIEWYKKAMNNGMVLDAATIFGYNSKTGKLMGAGEAGSETIVGTKTLLQMIKEAVEESNAKIIKSLAKCIDTLYDGMRTIKLEVIPSVGMERLLQSSVGSSDNGIDYVRLATQLAKVLREVPIQPLIDVSMQDGDVYLDNERVGRKVAPVVSRVVALGAR